MTPPPDPEGRPDLRRLYAVESVALALIGVYVWLLDRFVSSTTLVDELLAVIAFVAVPTVGVAFWRDRAPAPLLALSLSTQVLGVTAGIHFGGGVDQVSGPLLYGLLVGLAGMAFSGPAAFATAGLSGLLYATLVALEQHGTLPHLVSYSRPPDRQLATVIGVAAYLQLLAWLVSHTTGQVRRARSAARRYRLEAVRARGVTVSFSDVVGSTELTERLGDAGAQRVLGAHARTVRRLLARHAGLEIQRQGDGFLAWFPSPRDAVRYAIALQREPVGPGSHPVAVRVGIHAGPAIPEEGTFFGKTVIVACRMAARAQGGEILVSDAVREQLAAGEFALDDARLLRLKGLSEPQRVHSVAWEPAGAAARTRAPSGLPVEAASGGQAVAQLLVHGV
jgi:class 3 adenylate cyclase